MSGTLRRRADEQCGADVTRPPVCTLRSALRANALVTHLTEELAASLTVRVYTAERSGRCLRLSRSGRNWRRLCVSVSTVALSSFLLPPLLCSTTVQPPAWSDAPPILWWSTHARANSLSRFALRFSLQARSTLRLERSPLLRPCCGLRSHELDHSTV